MAKRGRPKRETPLTAEELAQREARYAANRLKARRLVQKQLREERHEWQEIGWIVRKMNKEAKISQESIWELLGGLVNKKKIAKWCSSNYLPR